MAWIYLFFAGLLEIVWATALKYTDGFTQFWPSAIGVTAATASFFLLALALRTLPIGTAYAIWVGIGIGGVTLFGVLALGESASLGRMGFLTLLLLAIIGLKLVEG